MITNFNLGITYLPFTQKASEETSSLREPVEFSKSVFVIFTITHSKPSLYQPSKFSNSIGETNIELASYLKKHALLVIMIDLFEAIFLLETKRYLHSIFTLINVKSHFFNLNFDFAKLVRFRIKNTENYLQSQINLIFLVILPERSNKRNITSLGAVSEKCTSDQFDFTTSTTSLFFLSCETQKNNFASIN